jgi:hypothetical protein
MNFKQKSIIEQIISDAESEFVFELLDFFLDKGLGSVSKYETDIFIFYLIEKYQKQKGKKLSNFELSSLLKISERKIKNLKLEVGIRYSSNEEDDELSSWLKLLELISEGFLEFESAEKIILTIEDPYLLRFIEHNLKISKQQSTDYSFNSERVKLKVSSLKILLKKAAEALNMINGKSKAEQTLKSAIRKNYGEDIRKGLFSILKDTIPSLITGVVNQTLVFQIKFCGKSPALRVAAKR